MKYDDPIALVVKFHPGASRHVTGQTRETELFSQTNRKGEYVNHYSSK